MFFSCAYGCCGHDCCPYPTTAQRSTTPINRSIQITNIANYHLDFFSLFYLVFIMLILLCIFFFIFNFLEKKCKKLPQLIEMI